MLQSRDKILIALEKDLERRYISTSRLQADGRLELDKACIGLLDPQDGEEFSIIDDISSIIIVRKPLPAHQNKVICTAKFDEKKNRLRLAQRASRILLTCTVGIRVFRYNGEIALEAEPFIEPVTNLAALNLTSFDELAPYILRSSRSVLHIDVLDQKQNIQHSGTTFRILGEYWIEKYHQNIMDTSLENLRCQPGDCDYCKNKTDFPIIKKILWFPAIAYENRSYARPAILSFHQGQNTSTMSVCADLVDKCERWRKYSDGAEQYFRQGIMQYHGKNLFKIFTNNEGFVEINDISSQHPKYKEMSIEEKGLMKLALKELEMCVVNYKI